MSPADVKAQLLKYGRKPLGKLIEMPLKQAGKILYADVKNGRAYNYFMVDLKTCSIREGHIYQHKNKKVFGEYDLPRIPMDRKVCSA